MELIYCDTGIPKYPVYWYTVIVDIYMRTPCHDSLYTRVKSDGVRRASTGSSQIIEEQPNIF